MRNEILALAALLATTAGADSRLTLEPKHFRFSRPIQTSDGAGLFRVDLPEGVYAGVAHDDLRDLRVFNHDGVAVPASFQRDQREQVLRTDTQALTFYPVRGEATKAYAGASRVSMTESAGQRSVVVQFGDAPKGAKAETRGYLVDLGKNERALRRIELDWADGAETGFFTVKVEGSDDLTHWHPIGEPATLARFQFGGNRLERKTLELTDARAKYLLVTWTERPSLPLKGMRGEFTESAWVEPKRHATRVATVREPSGDYVFEKIPVPADQLAVALPDVNTLVRVELLSRADAKGSWYPRASALLYRIRVGDREVLSEPLTFPPTPDRHWKLRLVGADASLGAKAPEVEFRWIAHQLFFVAQGAGPFVLAYGQEKAGTADFGMASVTAAFGTDPKFAPALAALGAEIAQAATEPATATAPGDPNPMKKYALWALLVGGILLTSLMAMKLLRDLKSEGGAR